MLVSLPAVFAQTDPSESFDDLAKRAESLLDSRPGEAAALYKRALAARPSWAEGWFYLGAASYGLRRYPEARDAFQKSIEIEPGKGTAWAFLGLCEYELGNFERVLTNVHRAEQLGGIGGNPDFETTVRERAAAVLVRSSLFDQAMAQLQPLARRRVESPAIIDVAGLCALGTPQLLSELTPARQKVVRLAGRAQWAAASQRQDEAEPRYRELLATYPNEPGVHYAHGLFLMETDRNSALSEFQTELKANPQHWPSMMASAFLETGRGNPKTAVASVQTAMKIAPAGYRWLCEAELGRAYLMLNEIAKAIPLFESAIKQAPNSSQTRFYLGQAYRRAGRKDDAQRELAEFVRLRALQEPAGTANPLLDGAEQK